MVKGIYIMSTAPNSGKTAFSIGLFLSLKDMGKKVIYYKPIGDPYSDIKVTKADKDVNVILKLLERKYSQDEICGLFISPTEFLDEIPTNKVQGVKELIKEKYENLFEKDNELVIIEGNHHYLQFYSLGLTDLELSKILDTEVVLISRLENDSDFDKIIIAIDKIKERNLLFKGLVVTEVDQLQRKKIDEKYTKLLNEKNIELIGIVPKSNLLSSPTIGEVFDTIGGRPLTVDIKLVKDNIIEKFIIGAMQSSDALKYLRQSKNFAVITGGDRSDIILMAVELDARLIILTGNLEPDVLSIAKAEEKNIPVLLVPTDTYSTAYKLQNIKTQIQLGETELCKKQVQKNINWKILI
ncbi:MAG: DRTGG domain-containing protein [Promethearchaeota archaeon]